ncbi:flagellar hook-length control protein FliK [Pelagibacterium sp.]|uniref:flagellar hook-length control protein FliK n=1 Tax=Pelagibacterium sp. TaxID=1967288 RepID=UPI003A8FACA7
MTNAISIGNKLAPTIVPAKPGSDAGSAIDFSSLITRDETAKNGTGNQIGPAASPVIPTGEPLAEAELGNQLAALLEQLTALSEKLKDGETIDATDLDQLHELLAGIEGLLDQGTALPPQGSPALAALSDLAAELGVDSGQDAGALDTLAALSSHMADKLRDDAPELAARLTTLTRNLDSHAAAIQSALADEQSQANLAVKHAESETRLNPVAAIAAQEGETGKLGTAENTAANARQTDTEAGAERSLVQGGQADKPASGNDSKSAPQQNGAAGGAAATSPQDNIETPDGLTIQAGQPQNVTAGSSALARPEAAVYQRPDAQINLPHVAAEISRHVQNGVSRFEIRLNPAELGRIDVRMEMDNSGNVVARLAVERSETLDLLQRDQRALERALSEAGLDPSKTELEFSLGQQSGGRDGNDTEQTPWRMSIADTSAQSSAATDGLPERASSAYGYARLDAVNLWV